MILLIVVMIKVPNYWKQKYSQISYNSGNAISYSNGGKINYGNENG